MVGRRAAVAVAFFTRTAWPTDSHLSQNLMILIFAPEEEGVEQNPDISPLTYLVITRDLI